MDFAGPLYMQSNDDAQSKVWICLYTCSVVGAVHLDLIPNMSAPTFLRNFKRFAARRGLPSHVISDKGKTFKQPLNSSKSRGCQRIFLLTWCEVGVQCPQGPMVGRNFQKDGQVHKALPEKNHRTG